MTGWCCLTDFHGFDDKLKYIVPGSILFTAVLRPKVDFLRETLRMNQTKSGFPNIDDYLVSSNTCDEFFPNIKENFSFGVIGEKEMATRGQCGNSSWFLFGKGIITTSKSLEVMTKMKKCC